MQFFSTSTWEQTYRSHQEKTLLQIIPYFGVKTGTFGMNSRQISIKSLIIPKKCCSYQTECVFCPTCQFIPYDMFYITLVDSYQHVCFTLQICVHTKNVCLTLFLMIHIIKCGSHHAHVITPKEYCSHQNKYSSHPNSEDSYH